LGNNLSRERAWKIISNFSSIEFDLMIFFDSFLSSVDSEGMEDSKSSEIKIFVSSIGMKNIAGQLKKILFPIFGFLRKLHFLLMAM
jgi:hypothetical protein